MVDDTLVPQQRIREIDGDPESHLNAVATDIGELGDRAEKQTISDKEIAINISIFRERLAAVRHFLGNRDERGDKSGLVRDKTGHDWAREIEAAPGWHLSVVSDTFTKLATALGKGAMDAEVALAISDTDLRLSKIQRFIERRNSPGFSSVEAAKAEQSKGYQEIMRNEGLRRKIAEYILRAASPELVAYEALCDRIEKELKEEHTPTEKQKSAVTIRTAWRYLLGSRTKCEQFVFREVIENDKAYQAFMSRREFRNAFRQSIQKHNVTVLDYAKDYREKVKGVADDIKREYEMDALLFARFFVGTLTRRESLDAMQ